MLPKFYLDFLKSHLSESQLLSLRMLVWLLQRHKQVKLERLAACLPLPILYESRRRHVQRFLVLKQLSISLLWLPLIKKIIHEQIPKGIELILALDRTQWQDKNLFMVSLVWHKRAFPIYWQFLDDIGSSNLAQQKAVLRPALRLLKAYNLIVVGDREFHSIQLADWLEKQKVQFALRQKQNTYFQERWQNEKPLNQLNLRPGMKVFLRGVRMTKSKGFGRFNVAGYWKRKYRGKQEKEPWYLLTNLDSLEKALKVYKFRSGIEAMFKDCKTGGYNLEGSKASVQRLTNLVLLMAIAYTCAALQGLKIKQLGQQKYVNRLKELKRPQQRHSNFWVGLYGQTWIASMESEKNWLGELMRIRRNKLPFYLQGLRAMSLIQQAF